MEGPPQDPESQAGDKRAQAGQKPRQGRAAPAEFLSERSCQHVEQKERNKHAGIGDRTRCIEAQQSAKADGEQHRRDWEQQRSRVPADSEAPTHRSAEELTKSSASAGLAGDRYADDV